MSASKSSPLVSEEYLQELDRLGQALYETKFKALLESQQNNQYVVIHVDTEDYAIGRTFIQASRAIRARHPVDGRLFGRKIGPEPDNDLWHAWSPQK